jgi:hypothetical protein
MPSCNSYGKEKTYRILLLETPVELLGEMTPKAEKWINLQQLHVQWLALVLFLPGCYYHLHN